MNMYLLFRGVIKNPMCVGVYAFEHISTHKHVHACVCVCVCVYVCVFYLFGSYAVVTFV